MQLNYNVAYLPGPIFVVNVADDNFVASNGQDLFIFHVDSDMHLHSKFLAVKGIHLISNHTRAGELIAATVSDIYILHYECIVTLSVNTNFQPSI